MLNTLCPICNAKCSITDTRCPSCSYEFGSSKAKPSKVVRQNNLIPCSDCGNPCSRYAVRCPKCGRPFVVSAPEQPSKTYLPYIITAIIGVIVFGGIFAMRYREGYFDRFLGGKAVEEKAVNTNLQTKTYTISPEANKTVNEALKGLRKIGSAIDIGVSFQEYSRIVIEAKAQVDEATRQLPQGELKKALEAAIEAYGDAKTVWNNKIFQDDKTLYSNYGIGITLIPKYKMKASENEYGPGKHIDSEMAMQLIWLEGRKQVDRVAELLK